MTSVYGEDVKAGDLVEIVGWKSNSVFAGDPETPIAKYLGHRARVTAVEATGDLGGRVVVDAVDAKKYDQGIYWGNYALRVVPEKVVSEVKYQVGEMYEVSTSTFNRNLNGMVGRVTAVGAKKVDTKFEHVSGPGGHLGPYWLALLNDNELKPYRAAQPVLRRRDLNPGDLFYYLESGYKSKTPVTQLRYVKGNKDHEPDPALGAEVSPPVNAQYMSAARLDCPVRKVEGAELDKLKEEAKKHKVTEAEVETAAAMCSIMAHYKGSDFAYAARIMGESIGSKTSDLARAALWAEPKQYGWESLKQYEQRAWPAAAKKLMANELPKGWVNGGARAFVA